MIDWWTKCCNSSINNHQLNAINYDFEYDFQVIQVCICINFLSYLCSNIHNWWKSWLITFKIMVSCIQKIIDELQRIVIFIYHPLNCVKYNSVGSCKNVDVKMSKFEFGISHFFTLKMCEFNPLSYLPNFFFMFFYKTNFFMLIIYLN
jgi:hypothetical protein